MLSPRSLTVAVLPVVLALAACGGGGKSGVAGTTTKLTNRSHHVTAIETEYRIQLSQTSLQPGTYTFVAVNKGHVAHSLEVDGPGVSDQEIEGTIAPGETKQLTVTLQNGTYEVYCPVDGHKGQGMKTEVTVGGAPATTESTESTTTKGGGY